MHPRCYILDVIHELMPELASQQPTQKSYKKMLTI